MSNKIQFIFNSDLLEVKDVQIIAQQCNCKSKTCKGLAEDIANKYPYANFYSARKEDSKPGTIKVVGSPKKGEKYICAMFAQIDPGKPKKGDTSSQREEWFKECLDKISKKKGVKSIAFPYGIGGGNWDTYCSMIENWAEENPNIKVKIINQNGEPKEEVKTTENINYEKALFYNDNLDKFFNEYTKKIESLTLNQKARLLDHLLRVIRSDMISASYNMIDKIILEEEINNNNLLKKECSKDKDIINEKVESDKDSSSGNSSEYHNKDKLTWSNTSLLDYTKKNTPEGWDSFFENILENEGLNDVSKMISKDSKKHEIYPPIEDVYNAFELCPMNKVKVVIIGQDPYPTPGAAMGLAFGHCDGRTKLQPSLRNIYKCLKNDGFSPNMDSGNLSKWASQGVFLINTALTVKKGEAGSYVSKTKSQVGPWDYFMGRLFNHLNENCEHLVIILWGLKAQVYESSFSKDKHFHIKAPHPAAGAYNPSNTDFLDHKPFSRANKQLGKWGKETINWNLELDENY